MSPEHAHNVECPGTPLAPRQRSARSSTDALSRNRWIYLPVAQTNPTPDAPPNAGENDELKIQNNDPGDSRQRGDVNEPDQKWIKQKGDDSGDIRR